MAISSWAMMAVLAVVVCGGRVAEGQPDCVSKLIPCADYLNSTKPSKECCDGMRTVVTTQLDCLCGLINDPQALAGINLTQALELPKYCNLSSDTSVCKAAAAPRSSLPPPVVQCDQAQARGCRRCNILISRDCETKTAELQDNYFLEEAKGMNVSAWLQLVFVLGKVWSITNINIS